MDAMCCDRKLCLYFIEIKENLEQWHAYGNKTLFITAPIIICNLEITLFLNTTIKWMYGNDFKGTEMKIYFNIYFLKTYRNVHFYSK